MGSEMSKVQDKAEGNPLSGAAAPGDGSAQSTASQTRPGEPVWSFRGYRMSPAEFNAAMVHFYRGEVTRTNTWRTRLDMTTNWAVITAGAALSFALSEPTNPHGIIPLNTVLVAIFLYIEARRYRYYELWSYRVRLMETDFFAAMLVPPFAPRQDWAESLAESLLHPQFPISMWEALGRRFRRNYVWIFLVLGLSWGLKNIIHPTPATSLADIIERAAIGPFPGWMVLLAGLIFNGLIFLMGLLTAGLHQASGEVLPRFGEFPGLNALFQNLGTHETEATPRRERAWQRPHRQRQQVLSLIMSSKPQVVADRIMRDLHRGVTALHGKGMYSGEEREVLLCATTVTEVPLLKSMINEEDPHAFVVVAPAHEVAGAGFQPLVNQ
jgi:uncharacterized membrane protein